MKQKLAQLLENVKLFTKSLNFSQYHSLQMYGSFTICFQQHINNLKESLFTTANLQQSEKEFKKYFSRIQNSILYGENQSDVNNYQLINIFDFLYKLMAEKTEELIRSKWQFQEIQFDSEYLVQLAKKIHLQENDEEQEVKSNHEDKFSIIQQKNDEWKIKQGLVLTIIQISLNSFTETITRFSQQALIQLWVLEKDQRVRNLLKDQNLISLQMQILQKVWQTQNYRIAGEMQKMLKRIDELQESISLEANLKKRELYLLEMDETTAQLDQYIQNISEMGQYLKLITDFVNHIRKGMIRVEEKINEMKKQLNSLGNEVKFLRGKSVEELFEIRKSRVMKEAANNNIRSLFVPLFTLEIFHKLEKGKKYQQRNILMNLENFYDKKGALNEFLLDDEEKVLLIHGIAGSGKSTAAKKIEEFILKLHDNNQKIAVEEAHHQDEYGFDELQQKECKEMLEKKKFRLLIIMDSYDEMKLKIFRKTYILIINLNTIGQTHLLFLLQEAKFQQKQLKEILLLKFDFQQIQEYLEKFTIQSITMLIFEMYEWQTKISNRRVIDIIKFEIYQKQLQQFLKKEISGLKGENLLNEKQIDHILTFLKNNEFISLKSHDALRSLSINLQKLWSVEKYEKIMKQINLNKQVLTPLMMEIVVQVLPQMTTEINNLKYNFIKNFSNRLKEFYKSKQLIQMYRQQQKKLVASNYEYENSGKVDYDEKFEITLIDIEDLEKRNYQEIAMKFWDQIEENSVLIQFYISQQYQRFQTQLLKIFQQNHELSNQLLLTKITIQIEKIIEVVIDAFTELNLTSYDFYEQFINQHHQKYIEKLRKQGKSINIDGFLHDLKRYSTNLAKTMSKNKITQVQYQQYGLLYKEERENQKQWLNDFFNDDDQFGSYRKDIRSCSLVQSNGSNFKFAHKSIQEFLIAADLYEVLVQSKDFDIQIMNTIIEMLTKENNQQQNCLNFLSNLHYYQFNNQIENIPLLEKQKQFDTFQQTLILQAI
ncbi:unnamed protein product [Paramecium pentaurelia]|uniref:Uncharacterized protein n=1 Tax=Paramecium pentaurelia TaxID=43138 RepID=A0A8S1WN03_9CILI|nr:unnamed protein product [Paramecium pentaurelia]